MTTLNIHGFNATEVANIKPRQFTAFDYLKNQRIFLKRLAESLDRDSKAGTMVDAQIANLEMAIEEVSK